MSHFFAIFSEIALLSSFWLMSISPGIWMDLGCFFFQNTSIWLGFLDFPDIMAGQWTGWSCTAQCTLPLDQTIRNRILSKVCCDFFSFGIRITCINQHNIMLWITVRIILNNRKPCYFIPFPKIIIQHSFLLPIFNITYIIFFLCA